MKPVTPFDNYPSFGNAGARQAPGDAKYALGFVAADTFPAEWANYFFHGATKGVSDLNSVVRSIWLELESVLTSYGITPSAESTDQILTALSKIYPKITTCNTAASTGAKDIAISGNVLKPGDIYVITMTYGNTASNPTLMINSVPATSAPLCDANGNALGNGAWTAGDTITLLYTGSKYLMSTRAVTDTITSGDMSPVTSNAVAVSNAMPVDEVTSGNMHSVTSNAVSQSLSYSTTEQETGGVWIDGKPIYRKVYTELNYSVSPNTWYVTDIPKAGIDEILELKTIAGNGTLYNFIGCTKVYNPTYLALWVSRSDAINVTGLIIEYTKTTD